MVAILDSGARREFETGAVRDIADGKGRVDLLPLAVIGEYYNDTVLLELGRFVETGNLHCLWKAFDDFVDRRYEGDIWTALLELSIHYEQGAKKYSDRNWEKGMPVHCFVDSAGRHYMKYMRGDMDEPHDRAFLWNVAGAVWMTKNHPEMADLPFKEKERNDGNEPSKTEDNRAKMRFPTRRRRMTYSEYFERRD